jgi:hypothetical protein
MLLVSVAYGHHASPKNGDEESAHQHAYVPERWGKERGATTHRDPHDAEGTMHRVRDRK